MLLKPVRLKKTRDFASMATKGRSVYGTLAVLRVRRVDPKDLKIAFIVSTKIFKKAVDRNRAKRRYREVVRLNMPAFNPGFHYIFILRPETLTAPTSSIKEEILHMLSKVDKTMEKPLRLSPRAKKELGRGKVKHGARFVKPNKSSNKK